MKKSKQLENVTAYKAGSDDMCDTLINTCQAMINDGVITTSIYDLIILLTSLKLTTAELESETVNNIVGKDENTVQH